MHVDLCCMALLEVGDGWGGRGGGGGKVVGAGYPKLNNNRKKDKSRN